MDTSGTPVALLSYAYGRDDNGCHSGITTAAVSQPLAARLLNGHPLLKPP